MVNPFRARRVRRVCLALVLFARVLLASTPNGPPGEPRNIRFRHLSLEDGLSQDAVNCIAQDQRGFLWFGTQDGLNRYDGYTITVFKRDAADQSTLSNNAIWSVHADRRSSLWIGTDGGGLERMDLETGAITHYRNDPDRSDSLSNNRVRVVAESRDGALWIGTEGGGLNRLDVATGRFTRYLYDPANPRGLASGRVRAITEAPDGALWIGTDGGGLSRLDPDRTGFTTFHHEDADSHSLADERIRCLLVEPGGILWVGTYQAGLDRFDPKAGTFTHFRSDTRNPRSLAHDRVWTLIRERSGTLWVGTDGGLSEFRGDADGFATYRNDPADPGTLSDSRILTAFQDQGGVLWLGTQAGGLNRWNPMTGSFALYRAKPGSVASLTGNTITSFASGKDGVLWVGTFEGLNRMDRRTGEIRTYRHNPADPTSLSEDQVMSLLADDTGALWVGTLNGGLNRLSPSGGFMHYRHDPANPSSLSGDGITSLHRDRKGALWIGTFRAGLNRFDPSGSFIHYRHDAAKPTSLSDDMVFALAGDDEGNLWVGTELGGLNRFDSATGTFTATRHRPVDPSSLGSGVIFSIHEDRSHTLWIGTQGGGLSGWSADDRRNHRTVFSHLTERSGLPNNTVYGILEDPSGALWLSTNKGLASFDPVSRSIRTFDAAQGLQGREFSFGAWHRAPSGEFFFGGNHGFNAFFPAQTASNVHVPPVVLTSFEKMNRPAALPRTAWETKEVSVTHQDPVITFEFAALDYTAPEKNRYAYRLDGFDKDWVASGNVRRATYTNLNPGLYTFRVRASNSDGVWNNTGAALRVRVIPPPWRSWWAHTVYALLFLLALGAAFRTARMRVEREAMRGRILERQVEERTRELAERNTDLSALNQKLEDLSATDSLTGLANRRFATIDIHRDIALLESYEEQIRMGVEGSPPRRPDVALIVIDLDGFKEVNDTLGHLAGDRLLIQMRAVLERPCRRSDTIVRWGGDEFLVIARLAEPDVVASLAERIRKAVDEHPFEVGAEMPVHVTCSIGWALFPFVPSVPALVGWEGVLSIADRSLYSAKHSGRNAWVGILSNEKTPAMDLVHTIVHQPLRLAQEGAITVKTSITAPRKLVWERGSLG